MQTFITTCSVVLPTFLMIALGYLLRRLGLLDEPGSVRMNRLAFNVLIPAMVFYNIYCSPLDSIANWQLIAFAAGSVTLLFAALMVVVPWLEPDSSRRGVIIQGVFRSSFVVLGVGLVSSMYGSDGVGVTAMLSAVIAPLFNGYAVVALEFNRGGKPDARRILRGVATNPLILASVFAVAMLLFSIQLPGVVESVLSSLSATATPIALMVLGAEFEWSGLRGRGRSLAIACAGKLVISPLIFIPIAVWLGFRRVELLTLLVLFGSPNAVSSHIMASNSGGDDLLAGQIVVFSTSFSVITLFAFIYVLISLRYL